MGQAIRNLLQLMSLFKEVTFIFDIHVTNIEVFCKILEENQSCIEVDQLNKFLTQTKHIVIKYHHLIIFIQKNLIRIFYIINMKKHQIFLLNHSMTNYF